jgi:hypothetical protein
MSWGIGVVSVSLANAGSCIDCYQPGTVRYLKFVTRFKNAIMVEMTPKIKAMMSPTRTMKDVSGLECKARQASCSVENLMGPRSLGMSYAYFQTLG